MTETFVLYSTFPNRDEALFAARALLERRLIACANVYGGVTSLYRWEGTLQQEEEAVLIAKTSKEKLQAAIGEARRLHSYEVPCIIACPVTAGFPPFLEWVTEETR